MNPKYVDQTPLTSPEPSTIHATHVKNPIVGKPDWCLVCKKIYNSVQTSKKLLLK